MQGNNTIFLNQATMLEAMQMWLEATFKNAPRATKVEERANSNDGQFVVLVESLEPPPRT